ncbi:MAG TPA: AAA family ATPase [Arsenophonus sp.]
MIKSTFEERIKQGELIAVDGDANLFGHFIRKDVFDNEVKILSQILWGKNSQTLLIQDRKSLNFTGLTQEQQKVTGLVLTSKDQIILIQGYAGVGKTTQFRTVAQAIKNNRPDVNVIGLAPTHKAVSELNAAGIKSQTIASCLMENNTMSRKSHLKIPCL